MRGKCFSLDRRRKGKLQICFVYLSTRFIYSASVEDLRCFERSLGLISRSAPMTVADVWNYPSAFRVYYNNAPVTLDDSCFCETFTYSLNYYSCLSCLNVTTERKSIRAANRNEFGAGSARLSTVSDTHTCNPLYFADPHALARTCLHFSSFYFSVGVLSRCAFISRR